VISSRRTRTQREIAIRLAADYDQFMNLSPRPMPVETLSGLRPPLAGYPYFAHADAFPFEPLAADESDVNAWWLADASFLVYGTAAFVERAFAVSPLAAQSFRLEWLGTPDNNRGMVLTSDAAIVVVFRGTRVQVHSLLDSAEVVLLNQNDLWIDGQFFPAVHRAGGKVHAGFMKAFTGISDRLGAIVTARRPGQALWLTGHSMGGALATLAAAHLGREAVHGLYTYGCPRVGDVAFASVLPVASHLRFVHRDDWVPTMPPEFLGYVHAGKLRPVTGSPPRNLLSDLTTGFKGLASALQAMAAESRIKADSLPFKVSGLADHTPVYYATLLWNALVENAPG
jgi:triacylglycerol lipase